MGRVRPVILIRGVHLHGSGLAVFSDHIGADVTAGDLRAAELLVAELRHVVVQAPIRDVAADGSGVDRRPGRDRGNGIAVQHSAVSRRHAAESPGYKARGPAGAHSRTAGDHRVTHVGIALELVCEASEETASGSRARDACRTARGGTRSLEDASCRTAVTAGKAGDSPGSEQKLHAHAGAGLGYVQPHGRQIGIELLGGLQEGQHAEQPQEHIAHAGRERAAVADKRANRRVKGPQEPDVHDQQQKLRAHHPAPGAEHVAG